MMARVLISMAAAVAFCAIAGAVTVVVPQTVRLDNERAYIFSAPLSDETPPRLFILDGRALTVFDESGSSLHIELPLAASAIDVYDIDGNGVYELLVVAGRQVMSRAIRPGENGSAWQTVFERASVYSDTAALPFPQVLALEHDGATVIALPQVSEFELWSLDGTLSESVPYGTAANAPALPALPFEVQPVNASYAGVGNDMVHLIDSEREPAGHPGTPERSSPAPGFGADVSDLPSDQWPEFPLRLDADEIEVLHAPVPAKFEDTYIRIRSSGLENYPRIGPPRRYPGRLLFAPGTLPDFNGDGFVDLVTWKPAVPGMTLNGLLDLLRHGTSPVNVSTHLYNPQSRLFEAQPLAVLRANLPRSWFEEDAPNGPIRNLVLDDLDGDGFIDVGFSTKPAEYSIWSYKLGFHDSATYVVRTGAPIESVVRNVPVGTEKTRHLLLRGPDALHIVRFPLNQ